MLSRQLEARPNAQKVVVDVIKDVGLPTRISAKTLELIWAVGEQRNSLGIALPKPVIGLPFQEGEDPSHLLFKKHGLLLPPSLPRIGLRPFKTEL